MKFNALSHDTLATQMLRQLESHRLVGLVGLPGSGKSFTCRNISRLWKSNNGVAISAPGDEFQVARRYFPFHHAISQSSPAKQLLVRNASGAMAKGASAIPFAGPLAGFVIEKLFNHSIDSKKEQYQFISSEEQNILYRMQELSSKHNLIVICDDVQFWDESSLSLLRMMLSGRIDGAYPFLVNTRYVVVQTVFAATEDPPLEFRSLGSDLAPINVLDYVSQADLPVVLRTLGMRGELPDDVVQAIHSICGGHLHVLTQLVDYVNGRNLQAIDEWVRSSAANFAANLVVSRLKALGKTGDDLLSLLKTASIIGMIFSDHELACLCDREPPDVRKLLATGEGMHLVRRERQSSHFAHGIVHQSLQQVGSLQAEDLHRQFSSCLKKLRPADYRSRMRHLLAAGDKDGAAILAVCCLLQDRRNSACALGDDALHKLAIDSGLREITNLLLRAQDLIEDYNFPGAITLLSQVDPVTPLHLQAEAGYLHAVCLIKAYTYDARDRAIQILNKWISRTINEEELRIRMQSTLLVALTHQRLEDDAKSIEEDIIQSLSHRLLYDDDAIDALRILDRKSDLIYPADISRHRHERSKKHFESQLGGAPRNIFQYCASTLNLSANCIACGRYTDAIRHISEITSFLHEAPSHQFGRFEILMNNLIISEFLGGIYDANIAAQHFKKIVEADLDTMDFALISSNYGACTAISGNLIHAREILEVQYGKLNNSAGVDDLHIYLNGSNLSSVLYLLGERHSAIDISSSLERFIDTAMPPHRSYFRDRHRILHQAMESGENFSVDEWDRHPLQVFPSGAGPCWRHYGRGFILTDLQIFTES